jgi:uncharacterized membrane protein YoaK (UPF0700 family)
MAKNDQHDSGRADGQAQRQAPTSGPAQSPAPSFQVRLPHVTIAAHPLPLKLLVLVAISGIAMGAQSAAVRASDVRGVNTTFMTSTLMNAIARLVLRARGIREGRAGPGLPGAAWLTYAGGAVAGAFAEKAWHAGAVAMPLAFVCAVSATAIYPGTQERA